MQTPSRHSSFLLCTQAAVTLDFPAFRFCPQSREGAIVWQPNPNLPLRQNRQRYAGTLLVFLECYSSRSRPWLLPLPLIPFIMLTFPILAQFIPAPSFPLNLAGPICAAWFVLGLIVVALLSMRAPENLARSSRVYLEE